jgi:hypothetical protein
VRNKDQAQPAFLELDSGGLVVFVEGFRQESNSDSAETNKVMLRRIIESAEFDGENLKNKPQLPIGNWGYVGVP